MAPLPPPPPIPTPMLLFLNFPSNIQQFTPITSIIDSLYTVKLGPLGAPSDVILILIPMGHRFVTIGTFDVETRLQGFHELHPVQTLAAMETFLFNG